MFIRSLVHGDIADSEVLASLPVDNQRSCILAIFQVLRGRLGYAARWSEAKFGRVGELPL